MVENKRRHERFEFESPHLFIMDVGDGAGMQEAQFFLRNLSYSGMMVEFLSGYGPSCADKGCAVHIVHAPGALKDVLAGVRGIIVWSAGAVCGVCFEKQLEETSPTIRERLRMTNGSSWTK